MMLRLAWVLLAMAVLVGGARLFTGVIYLADEPTVLLVLKRGPAMWIERPEGQDRPVSRRIVLDREEPVLAYGWLYLALMRTAPIVVVVLAGTAIILTTMSRLRRKHRSRNSPLSPPPGA